MPIMLIHHVDVFPSRWQSFGSAFPIDEEHQAGEGDFWDVPCSSSSTAFDGNLSALPSIWASGHKYAAFRWLHSALVTCSWSQVESVFYSGHDLTKYLQNTSQVGERIESLWEINFTMFIPALYLYLSIPLSYILFDVTSQHD